METLVLITMARCCVSDIRDFAIKVLTAALIVEFVQGRAFAVVVPDVVVWGR